MLLLAIALGAAPLPAAAANDKAKSCPRTVPYYAYDSGKRLKPRKLTELPPATAYMAVMRQIGGCDAPLTMIEYRKPRAR